MRKLGAVLFLFLTACALMLAPASFAQQQVIIFGSEDGGLRGRILPARINAFGEVLVSSSGTTTLADGGTTSSTVPFRCSSSSVNTYTAVGTSATNVPASANASRYYIRICLTLEASGTPYLKCRSDGTSPAFGATAGEVLSPGDCVTYSSTGAVSCIANAASTPVSSYECL